MTMTLHACPRCEEDTTHLISCPQCGMLCCVERCAPYGFGVPCLQCDESAYVPASTHGPFSCPDCRDNHLVDQMRDERDEPEDIHRMGDWE